MLGRYLDLGNPLADHPLNTGLVSWWIGMPNTAGLTTLFDLKQKYNGTITNFASPFTNTSGWLPDSKTPFSSLVFDGNDDLVDFGTPTESASATAITVSCRAVTYTNASSGGGGGLRELIDASDIAIANGMNFILRYYPTGGYVEFLTNNGSGESPHAIDTINPTIGVEYHWVGVFDGSVGSGVCSLYRDGVLSNSVSAGMVVLNSTAYRFRVGNDYQSAAAPDLRPWNGTISDIRFYNRALSDNDVWQLYEQARLGHPNTLRWFSRRRTLVKSPAAALPITWKLKPNAQPGTIWEIYS